MDLYAKMTANMEDLASTFEARMLQHENNLKKISTNTEAHSHQTINTLSREFTDFKTLMWKSLAMLRSQMELLVQGLDRQETASRRKVLLFHGVVESNAAEVGVTIVKMLTDQFKLPGISIDQLSACHRLGTNTSKPRPVLVRFADYKLRSQIWNGKSTLKGSGITISEFLTKSRHDAFALARKHFGMHHCWTSEGKIVISLPDKSRKRIETLRELKPLLSAYPAVGQLPETKGVAGPSLAKGKTSARPSEKASYVETRSQRAAK